MKQGNTIQEITKAFELAADADKAQQMAAYMKNRFSFYGIQKPMRQQITKTWIKSLSTLPFAQLEKLCIALWKKPQREFQYLVMDILLKAKPTASSIRLYEQLILQKSWWDTVDLIAAKMAGNYFTIYPEQKNKYIKKSGKTKKINLIRRGI
ncbi:MAG TPA: DNA alkylation repair protein, partial [Cyclobacteriaceae bacterium]|nr:DNA alkylation repair protein [Cyclobacteriaceae bacterium]